MKNYTVFLCAVMLFLAMPTEINGNYEGGNNWWCMLYPDMYGIEDKSESVEIKLKIVEILERN